MKSFTVHFSTQLRECFQPNDCINFENSFNKEKFLEEVKIYLTKNKIEFDWNIIKKVDQTILITTLASICPFSIAEKQMLLECYNCDEIPKKMLSLFKMSDDSSMSRSPN